MEVVTPQGSRITVEPPAGGWTVEIATTPFEIVAGQATPLVLRFRHDVAWHRLDGALEFDPVFECD